MKRLTLPLVLLASGAVCVYASGERVDTLSDIVVTATRTPRLLKDVPVPTRVIGRQEITGSSAPDAARLLEESLPGVEMGVAMDQQPQFSLQGFSGGSVLFLEDGERLAGETLDNVDFSRLDVLGLGRIEIVKGASSALYGSGATGGVVNLLPLRPEKGVELTARARYGSHSRRVFGLTMGNKAGIFRNLLTAQYQGQGLILLPGGGDFTRVYAQQGYYVKERLEAEVSPTLRMIGRGGYFFRRRDAVAGQREHYYDVNAGSKILWRDFSLSYSFDRYDKGDWYEKQGHTVRDYSNRQHIVRGMWDGELTSASTLSLGGEGLWDELESYQFERGGKRRQFSMGLWGQYEFRMADRVSVLPALRYDYYSATRASSLTPKLAIMVSLGQWRLRGAYAAGFRAPTLKELYMDFDMAGIFRIYGNQNLKAERTHTFSLNGEWSNRETEFSVGGFYSRVRDKIDYLWIDELQGQSYINLPRMGIWGVEVNARYRWSWGLTARAGYVLTLRHLGRGTIDSSPTRPHIINGSATYSYTKGRYVLGGTLSCRWYSGVSGDVRPFFSSTATQRRHYPAYTMVKLGLSASIGSHVTLHVEADNLLNYKPEYYYYNSPLTTGIGFSGGVVLTL